MKILLDTHVIIWTLTGNSRLTDELKEKIMDIRNDIYFSLASIWEIAIKNQKNPSACPYNEKYIMEQCIDSGFEPLDISGRHICAIRDLRVKEGKYLSNYDPFDRILIAQAKADGMKLYSADKNFLNYDEDCIVQM